MLALIGAYWVSGMDRCLDGIGWKGGELHLHSFILVYGAWARSYGIVVLLLFMMALFQYTALSLLSSHTCVIPACM